MRKAPILIAILLALLTAGCVLSGKPGKPVVAIPVTPSPVASPPPAPPPQPLSIPQTQVELPQPQPVNAAALAVDSAPPVEIPAEAPGARTPGGRGAPVRPGPQQQRAETAPPPNPAAANPPAPTPPAAAPSEPPAQTIQEIIPAAELKRYQEQAQGRWKDIEQILAQLAKRRLSAAQEDVVTNVKSFLASSKTAEQKGDMKLADALAERAQIKAKDLFNGR